MARRLIGSGKTDSNGKVTVPFEGKGLGKIQVVAECGSLLSETYSIYDVLYKDLGTLKQHTTTGWTPSGMTVDWNTDPTCTILSQTTPATFTARYLNINSYSNQPFTMEWDMVMDCADDTKTGQSVSLRYGASSTGGAVWTAKNMGINDADWHHIKITYNNLNAILQLDDNDPIPREMTVIPNRFYFILNQDTSSSQIKYKNFIIY